MDGREKPAAASPCEDGEDSQLEDEMDEETGGPHQAGAGHIRRTARSVSDGGFDATEDGSAQEAAEGDEGQETAAARVTPELEHLDVRIEVKIIDRKQHKNSWPGSWRSIDLRARFLKDINSHPQNMLPISYTSQSVDFNWLPVIMHCVILIANPWHRKAMRHHPHAERIIQI